MEIIYQNTLTERERISHMLISNSSVSLYSHIQSRKLNSAQVPSEPNFNNSKFDFPYRDSVTISNNAKEFEGIVRDIANRYDVRNLSENERIAMARELFDNNLITSTQYAVMSFPIEKFASEMPGYEGTYDPNKKTDYLQQCIGGLALAKSMNASTQEIRLREEEISVLSDLNKFRNS